MKREGANGREFKGNGVRNYSKHREVGVERRKA